VNACRAAHAETTDILKVHGPSRIHATQCLRSAATRRRQTVGSRPSSDRYAARSVDDI